MRILFSAHVYSPSVGGIETVSRLLAHEFVRQGHEVRLITETPAASPAAGSSGESAQADPFPIHRQPRARELPSLVRWSDVFFHNNISLPKAWPLCFVRRPWVVAHHTWIPRDGLAARAKRYALRFAARCISISTAVAAHLETPSVVIPNPYDDAMFRLVPGVARDRDLVFLGRLVSDKGADLLLTAAEKLSRQGLRPTVTIVGGGPEEAALRAQAQSAGLGDAVQFTGPRRGAELVELLNRHRMLVVPSRWQEPFGVVALEGIASGCVVVASNGGGLRDAIGPCGEVFPNGDADALAGVLAGLLRNPEKYAALRQGAERHVQRHSREHVASAYLRVFAQALAPSPAEGRARGMADV